MLAEGPSFFRFKKRGIRLAKSYKQLHRGARESCRYIAVVRLQKFLDRNFHLAALFVEVGTFHVSNYTIFLREYQFASFSPSLRLVVVLEDMKDAQLARTREGEAKREKHEEYLKLVRSPTAANAS